MRRSRQAQQAQASLDFTAATAAGDVEGARDAEQKSTVLARQRAVASEWVAERGCIGVFVPETPPEEIRQRRKRSAVQVGTLTQLPLVASGAVACPNTVIRSALFGICGRGTPRTAMVRTPIACENDVEILYTGVRLGQKDFTVWLHCLRLVQDNMSHGAELSVYALTKEMGLSNSAANYEAILDSLARISSATVALRRQKDEIMIENRLLTYRVIDHGGVQTVQLKVDPQWATLFGVGRWTRVCLETRTKLKGKELALWLTENLATHNGRMGITTRTLHRLCGSHAELKEFRKSLRGALADCHSVGLLPGIDWQKSSDAIEWPKAA